MKEISKKNLFLKLAQPNENGISRWVSVSEFTGEYERLKLGNGLDFARAGSCLDRKYIIEKDRSVTPGNGIDRIRVAGFKKEETFNNSIRPDIQEAIRNRRCVMLGIRGTSINTTIEVDHKDGRKEDWKVSNLDTQKIEDFQPLCKAANDVKRQICKECKETNKRWNAKNISGNPYSYYEGDETYTPELGCVGCYQYDPVAYRKECVRKISIESSKFTSEYIFSKLYSNEEK